MFSPTPVPIREYFERSPRLGEWENPKACGEFYERRISVEGALNPLLRPALSLPVSARQLWCAHEHFPPMKREIKLDGGEILLLKTLGLSGTQMYGKMLAERLEDLETAEFLDTLNGLISLGYVLSNKVNLRLMEDVERAFFRVNSAYARDLRDALNPGRKRDEDRSKRRQRRS